MSTLLRRRGVGAKRGSPPPAIAFDAASSGLIAAGPTTITFSHTIGGGSNRLLIVGVVIESDSSPEAITSVTYDGVTMTAVPAGSDSQVEGAQSMEAAQFYLLESQLPAAGAHNVVVTLATAATSGSAAGAISLANVKQQAPEAVVVAKTTTDILTVSTNITTITNDAWVVDCFASASQNNATPTASGQVERIDQAANSMGIYCSTKPVAAAGSTAMAWDFGVSTVNRSVHVLSAWAPL